MKHLFVAATAVCCLMVATAAGAANADTVKVIENPAKVIITEDSLGSHVNIVGTSGKSSAYTYSVKHGDDDVVKTKQDADWNLNNPFAKGGRDRRSHWSLVCGGLYFGWGWYNGTSGNAPEIKDNLGHTSQFGILDVFGVRYSTLHGQAISLGVGFEARTYRIHNGMRFTKDDDGKLAAIGFPENSHKHGSQISYVSIQFPLMIEQRAGNVKFFAGPLLQLSPWSKIENKYTVNDRDYNENIRKIHQRIFTCDLMGGVSWSGCGLYVRYQPQNLFKSGWGPEFKSISMGIIIGM